MDGYYGIETLWCRLSGVIVFTLTHINLCVPRLGVIAAVDSAFLSLCDRGTDPPIRANRRGEKILNCNPHFLRWLLQMHCASVFSCGYFLTCVLEREVAMVYTVYIYSLPLSFILASVRADAVGGIIEYMREVG